MNNQTIHSGIWYNHGLIKVKQLYNNGKIIPFLTLRNRHNLTNNFLLHHSIISALPTKWKHILSNSMYIESVVYNNIDKIVNSVKASKVCYESFTKKVFIKPTAINVWSRCYNDINWSVIYKNINLSSNCVKSRYFQYKIVNRIIYLNNRLFRIAKVDPPLCYFCGIESETIEHFFFNCNLVNSFLMLTFQYLRERM